MKLEQIPHVISFDAGFTLIYPFPNVGDAYAGIAGRFGYHLDGDEVHRRFLSSWKRHTAENRQNIAANALASEEKAFDWWKDVFLESMGDLIKEEDRDEVFATCHAEYAQGKYWKIFADVLPTLEALTERGIELVVLSNWDRRLHQTLADLDLSRYFSHIYISTEIGIAKPQAGAFHHILNERGLQGQDVLHVGDSFEDDCRGARDAGLKSVLLDRQKLNTGSQQVIPVIHSLNQLLSRF